MGSQSILDYVCKALDCLVVGDDINFVKDDDNNNVDDDVSKINKALSLLRKSCQSKRGNQGQTRVNLTTTEGRKFYIHSNKHNNIHVPEVEKLIGKKVQALRIPQIVGGGYKDYHPENGYIACPPTGWSNEEYEVITTSPPVHRSLITSGEELQNLLQQKQYNCT